jgi:hypothetical protein
MVADCNGELIHWSSGFYHGSMKGLSIFALFLAGISLSVSLRAADEKKMTVVDYFLLLPDKTLETPARDWLGNAKIDKQNGYMDVAGDGAQPSFEVALFRYRDGRPLLALCEGELEGDNRVTLNFYELSANGRMQSVSRKIFPISDSWSSGDYDEKYADFRFELPRHGRTILVRSAKTKKILHKVAWNGEKFVEQRDVASN